MFLMTGTDQKTAELLLQRLVAGEPGVERLSSPGRGIARWLGFGFGDPLVFSYHKPFFSNITIESYIWLI